MRVLRWIFFSGSGMYPVIECPYEEVITSTSTTTTTSTTTITAEVTEPVTPTIVSATSTSDNEEASRPSTVISAAKDTSIGLIIGSVVGGIIVLSAIIVIFIWRRALLSHLGIKRPNDVAVISIYRSTDDTVEIDTGTKDRTHLA